jgi:hypothetical protein
LTDNLRGKLSSGRPSELGDLDAVMTPRSFALEGKSRTVGRAQVLSNTKLANDKLVNFQAPYPRAPDHQPTNGNCAKR